VSIRHCLGPLALILAATGGVSFQSAAAQAPQISKPRPVPRGPSNMDALPPAVIDNGLVIGGDDINARVVETRMTVDVHVNQRGPYRFLVDSGADTSVVGLKIARDLQLPLSTPVVLNGMTARNIVDRVKVAELTMGPSTIRDLRLPALHEGALGGEGMLGIDALVNQRLLMDFDKQIIRVEDARIPYRPQRDEIVITARRQRGQLILTEVNAGGLPLDAVIDTGSEVTIGNSALRDKIVRKTRDKIWKAPMTGVTGETVNVDLARISELRLGSVTLRNVYIAFADVPPFEVFGLSKQPALLLGTDVLEAFRRVSLDFRSRKVRFQLRKCTTTSITLSTTPTSSMSHLSDSTGATCAEK